MAAKSEGCDIRFVFVFLFFFCLLPEGGEEEGMKVGKGGRRDHTEIRAEISGF